jgi:hypothetical protein
MVACDAPARDVLQFIMLSRGVDDERRIKLFEDIAIFLQQHGEEFFHVVSHNIHLQPLNNARIFKSLFAKAETDDFFERKNMRPAQIVIGVGRRKSIKVRATDRREKNRVRLCSNDPMQKRVDGEFGIQYVEELIGQLMFRKLPRFDLDTR